MRGIFPYDRQEMILDFPKHKLQEGLKNNIQLTGYFPGIKNDKNSKFYGHYTSKTWRIILKSNTRNTSKPVVYLTMLEEGNKTRVIFEFKLNRYSRIFSIFWLSIQIIWIVVNIINKEPIDSFLIPFGFIIFLFIILYGGFYAQLERTMKTIENTIEKIITPTNTGA